GHSRPFGQFTRPIYRIFATPIAKPFSHGTNLYAQIAMLLFLFAATVQQIAAQTPPHLPCEKETPTFTGNPESTLCEQYPNFSCGIQIGVGTPFPKSSLVGSLSLSGNICIIGDFEVDEPFTFLNAIVKINPGVTISIAPSPNWYDPGSSLNIDNSRLFACNGLWKGITIGHLSTIVTQNNTEIEDAETAISATGLCELYIQQTTFNRDRVGIELNQPVPNSFVPGPIVWTFTGNNFTCDAPLNGTTDEITYAGALSRLG
ncbi:MAG TPA: hypothetical protein PK228_19055, partial [Saprospiraceae bacterium]|nr:hypothetical protein [Saprospiraceae bacterium]